MIKGKNTNVVFLCVEPYFKHVTSINSLNPHNDPLRSNRTITPIYFTDEEADQILCPKSTFLTSMPQTAQYHWRVRSEWVKGAEGMRAPRISNATRCLDSGHCARTTLEGTVAAGASQIHRLITPAFQQMAVKSLEEEPRLPNPHKDTECAVGAMLFGLYTKGSEEGKGMFSFHFGPEVAGVVQVLGKQGLN